jgi:uncharacterized protein YchJ
MNDSVKRKPPTPKMILAIAVVVLATSCQKRDKNSSGQNGSEEQVVMELEREMTNAYIQGDVKKLERIFADDLTTTSDSWKPSTKQDNLKHVQPLKGVIVDLSDVEAGLTRDKNGAIVTGVAAFQNGDKEHAYRFSDGFVKRQNGWQLISSDHRELKPLTVEACSQESSVKSLPPNYPAWQQDISTFTRFTNATSQPIVIRSLDSHGKPSTSEDKKKTLTPGRSANLHTPVMHSFLVTDLTGKSLGIYQPTEEPSLAVIK